MPLTTQIIFMHNKASYCFCKKLSAVFIVTLLGMGHLFAQHSSIQDLTLELSQAPEDSNKVYLYFQMADRFLHTHPEQSKEYIANGDQLSRKLGFTKGNAMAFNSLANLEWAQGNLREAISYLIESKNLAREIEDNDLIAKNIACIGLIYRAAGNHQVALFHYREAIQLFIKSKNTKRIAVLYNNLGKCFLEMGILDSSTYYFETALPLAENSLPLLLPHLAFNYADALYRQKKYVEAEKHLLNSLELATQYEDERNDIRAKQLLADIRFKQGKIDEAESLVKEALQNAERIKLEKENYQGYVTLAKIYRTKNDFDLAYHYLNLYNVYRDSIQQESMQARLDFLNFEQQQKEILLLTHEKAFEKAMRQRQKYSIYILSFLLVVIALLAYVLYRGRHRKSTANKLLQLKNTEINHQKEEMSAQADKLHNLNQLKNKLFSIISHDLRSPLNTLSGSLNLVQNGLIDQQEFQSFVPELIKNVSFTTTLLDNMLHWAKNQLEGTVINPEKINIKSLAKLNTESFQQQANHKNVTLINQIESKIYVFADEIMVQIVLQNLLTNAIKFCRSGDTITLSCLLKDNFAIVCVADTGRGISQENLTKLFDVNSFSTRGTANEKGTGLGLMLCKDFIEKNSGKIWVDSTVNQGSTFCFSLMLHEEQIAATHN